ncbi:hypothetical protein [Nocardiopsis sp. FIRDI 009]|uniref:hypothetical protein n=1 Tax=Nocardiopsis sp. FIRDI 009 TaxID=714197 RepID=UPI001E41A78C|nr:hypothetical protein [Nocardiopsis sp. FIRDI 009]
MSAERSLEEHFAEYGEPTEEAQARVREAIQATGIGSSVPIEDAQAHQAALAYLDGLEEGGWMSSYRSWRGSGHLERAIETGDGAEVFEAGVARLRAANVHRITITGLRRDAAAVFDQVARGETFAVTGDDGRAVPP